MYLDFSKFQGGVLTHSMGDTVGTDISDEQKRQNQIKKLLVDLCGSISTNDLKNVPTDILINTFYSASDFYTSCFDSSISISNICVLIKKAPRMKGVKKYLL